jgi:hypothetical protein
VYNSHSNGLDKMFHVEQWKMMMKKVDSALLYFEKIDTPEKAYILGFIFADGCNYRNESNQSFWLAIKVQLSDIDILEKIKNELNPNNRIYRFSDRGRFCASVVFSGNELSKKLAELGCVPRKSLIVDYPSCINNDLHSHFIRGYFDGNGSIAKQHREHGELYYAVQISGSVSIINSLNGIIMSALALSGYVYNQGKVACYRLKKANSVAGFLRWIYHDSTIFLDRKKRLADEIINLYDDRQLRFFNFGGYNHG